MSPTKDKMLLVYKRKKLFKLFSFEIYRAGIRLALINLYSLRKQAMSNISKQKLLDLKQQENEFLKLVDLSSREELAQCAKFLAMYIALYRQKFGDIPDAGYEKLVTSTKLDNELVNIVQDGISEATEMLKLVLLQNQKADIPQVSATYMN